MEREKIFVVLGTQKFQLNRLLIELDRLKEEGILTSEIFAQTGGSDYEPKHYSWKHYLETEAFEKKMEECSLVVVHSGVGSIISAIRKNKKVVVYPRLEKYHEHVDDHQCEIGQAFAQRGLVVYCGEKDDLMMKIQEAREMESRPFVSHNDRMLETIKNYIDMTQRSRRE